MDKKRRVFIDIDGTLAKWKNAEPLSLILSKNWFLSMMPLPSCEGIKTLIERNRESLEFFVISAVMKGSEYAIAEKNEWLDRHLPEIEKQNRIYTILGEPKESFVPNGIKETDILIDDYTKNLVSWEKSGGKGIKMINLVNSSTGSWVSSGKECVFAYDNELGLKLERLIFS